MCQTCFHHMGKTQHGGIPSNHWNMYRRTPRLKMCSLCWLSRWLGRLEFQHSATAPTCCVPLWSSPPTEGGKRCVTGLTVTAEKSNRDNQECNSIITKYLRLVFFPLSLGFRLSFSSFDAFPWEQRDRAGRCCCPWCSNNQTEQRGSSAGRFLLSVSLQPKHCKSIQGFKAAFVHTCGRAHVQTDTTYTYPITHMYTLKNIIMHIKAGLGIVM